MIEIKLDKLWQYAPGTVVLVDSYKMLYIGKTEDTVVQLYNYRTKLVEYCEGEDWNYDSVVVVLGRDLEQLVACQESQVLGLYQDLLDVEISKLSVLVKLKQVMSGIL